MSDTPDAAAPPRLLDGIRVLECGHGLAVAYAARVLADLGAEVTHLRGADIAVARRDDDPAFRAWLDGGKSIVAWRGDAATRRDDWFDHAAQADLLLDDLDLAHRPGTLVELQARCPQLVVVRVSPCGDDGPYAAFRAGDLELAYLSGLAHLTPRDIARPADPLQAPPLKMPASLVSLYGGSSVAGAALTALLARDAGGAGRHIEVALVESLIPTLRREIAMYRYQQRVASRFMRVWRLAPYGVKPCADGYVFLQVVERYHWEGLVEMLGRPAWALDPRYLDADVRYEERGAIEKQLAPWLLTQTKQAFAEESQRRGLPFAPVNDLASLPAIAQLRHRRFFRTLAVDGAPATVLAPPAQFRAPAVPGSAARADERLQPRPDAPLAGLRVIDFGHVWAGPYCTALLADMGAEVIKIESRQRIDIHRRQGPFPADGAGLNASGVWNAQNRGKRSVALNLATPEGRALARRLCSNADVVVENFAPGVMARLELDYDRLAAEQPALVMLSLSAFGQTGPQKGYIGYGPSLDAWAGLDWLNGYVGGPPNALGGVFPDTGSALYGAAALLAALHRRRRTGTGCYIDVSELEVSISLLADAVIAALRGAPVERRGNDDPACWPHGCYPADGTEEWVALSVPDARAWQGLAGLLGREDWARDPALADDAGRLAHRAAIEPALQRWLRGRSAAAAMRQLQQAGVPAACAHDIAGLLRDPQFAARGYFQELAHPEAAPLPLYGAIWRAGAAPRLDAAPMLGEGSAEVLGRVLGLAPAEIAHLMQAQIVH